jgi:hypothetical protein
MNLEFEFQTQVRKKSGFILLVLTIITADAAVNVSTTLDSGGCKRNSGEFRLCFLYGIGIVSDDFRFQSCSCQSDGNRQQQAG